MQFRRTREEFIIRPRLATTPPSFQVVCCIDDREESFRRHLEEIAPDCETFGAAGFFAVAMYYRGTADAHYTPLCPVIIRPQHYVNEDVVYTFERADRRRRQHRRTIGTMTHRVHLGSRTFAGGWLTAVFGSLASIPMVMRILFPRATAQVRKLMGEFVRPPADDPAAVGTHAKILPGPTTAMSATAWTRWRRSSSGCCEILA